MSIQFQAHHILYNHFTSVWIKFTQLPQRTVNHLRHNKVLMLTFPVVCMSVHMPQQNIAENKPEWLHESDLLLKETSAAFNILLCRSFQIQMFIPLNTEEIFTKGFSLGIYASAFYGVEGEKKWRPKSERNLSILLFYNTDHLQKLFCRLYKESLRMWKSGLTVALSKTLMEFSSAIFLFRSTASKVQRGRVSHFPKTTRSMSLVKEKKNILL